MDRWQAQQAFWESFNLPAYDDQTVFTEGDEPAYPHITYESFGGVMGQETTLNASLWYRSTSWEEISKKADEILEYMQTHRTIITINEGLLWLRVPWTATFARRFPSGADDKMVKRILLTIEAESLSNT